MKNLSLVINAVLAIAVAVLFYLQFSSCGAKNDNMTVSEGVNTDLGIAFVNIDSVILNYGLAIELNDAITSKQANMKNRLGKEMAEFEKEYQVFVDKAQRGIYLTQQRQQEAQQQLSMRQQELQQLEMEYSQQLNTEQQKMNVQLFDSINSYINRFNTPEKFEVILGRSLGGNILYGSEQLDITNDILTGLNNNYETKE